MLDRRGKRPDPHADALRRAVGRFQKHKGPLPVSLEPHSAHEAITREMVQVLVEDVADLRDAQKWVLRLVGGAVVLDVVTRLIGVGH